MELYLKSIFYFISEEETRERLLKSVKKEVCMISSLTAVSLAGVLRLQEVNSIVIS